MIHVSNKIKNLFSSLIANCQNEKRRRQRATQDAEAATQADQVGFKKKKKFENLRGRFMRFLQFGKVFPFIPSVTL